MFLLQKQSPQDVVLCISNVDPQEKTANNFQKILEKHSINQLDESLIFLILALILLIASVTEEL